MKKIFALCLVTMLLLFAVGCDINGNGETTTEPPIQSSNPYGTLVSWVNWSKDPVLVEESLNSDKLSNGEFGRLPIYKCESTDELNDFKNRFSNILSFSTEFKNEGGEWPSFECATAGFDVDFFEGNTLLLVYVATNTGSLSFDLERYSVEGDELCVYIENTNDPDTVTDDMAGWIISIPVSREILKNVKSYDAMIFSVAGNVFIQKEADSIWRFSIRFNKDGTFTYYEGFASSYIAFGNWTQEGNIITLEETSEPRRGSKNRFRLEDDGTLCFIAEGSDNFMYSSLDDGQKLVINNSGSPETFIPTVQ